MTAVVLPLFASLLASFAQPLRSVAAQISEPFQLRFRKRDSYHLSTFGGGDDSAKQFIRRNHMNRNTIAVLRSAA